MSRHLVWYFIIMTFIGVTKVFNYVLAASGYLPFVCEHFHILVKEKRVLPWPTSVISVVERVDIFHTATCHNEPALHLQSTMKGKVEVLKNCLFASTILFVKFSHKNCLKLMLTLNIQFNTKSKPPTE